MENHENSGRSLRYIEWLLCLTRHFYHQNFLSRMFPLQKLISSAYVLGLCFTWLANIPNVLYRPNDTSTKDLSDGKKVQFYMLSSP